MCGQKHDRDFPFVFDAAEVGEHFGVDVHFLVNLLEDLVQSPGHEADDGHPELADELVHDVLRFLDHESLLLLEVLGAAFLPSQGFLFDRCEHSGGEEDLGLDLLVQFLVADVRRAARKRPFYVREVRLLVVHPQQVRVLGDGKLSVLLEDVLLDSVVVQQDEILHVDLTDIHQKLLFITLS